MSVTTARLTLHLTGPDRELLDGIERRRAAAQQQVDAAHRDFLAASTAMATSRGLRRVTVTNYTDAGLVVEMHVSEEALHDE